MENRTDGRLLSMQEQAGLKAFIMVMLGLLVTLAAVSCGSNDEPEGAPAAAESPAKETGDGPWLIQEASADDGAAKEANAVAAAAAEPAEPAEPRAAAGSGEDGPSGKQSAEHTISVSGSSVIETQPDTAVMRVVVVVKGQSAGEARGKAARISDAVVSSLRESGAGAGRISSNFHLNPVCEWRNDRCQHTGYEVRHSVTARLPGVENAGEAADGVIAAGGDAVEIQGISFVLNDREWWERQALKEATENARMRAEAIASAEGRTVGRLLRASEGPVHRYDAYLAGSYAMMDSAEHMSKGTEIAVGDVGVSATVSTVFALE